jgi:prepilin-type N-terminal cleavage/methylation domain-containing protein
VRGSNAISSIRPNRGGFSLIELVIVIVIVAVLAAIAIPKLSRGSDGANDSALAQDLSVLQGAVDMYAAEHGGAFPSAGNITSQLTMFTDGQGNTSTTRVGSFQLGPYLKAVPPLPVGANRGSTGISGVDGAGVGWLYDASNGVIQANVNAAGGNSGGSVGGTTGTTGGGAGPGGGGAVLDDGG